MTNNYHLIAVKYLPATNTISSRVRLSSERFEESIAIAFDYQFNNIEDIAIDYLKKDGHKIIGKGEVKDAVVIICKADKNNLFKHLK